ncbi:MAG: hypothetical protein AAGA09_07675 [Pseudomonadota bacterium]
MKLIYAILASFLCMAVFVGWVALMPPEGLAVGGPHPDYPAMSIGGDGAARTRAIAAPVYLWQASVIVIASLFILLGVSPQRRTPLLFWLVGGAGAAMLAIWTLLFTSYLAAQASGETHYALGFPIPTAWMVYGVFLSHFGFCAIYVFGFRRFVYSDADEAAFQQLLQDKNDGAFTE